MSEHLVTIDWRRETPDFEDQSYNRDHDWVFDAGITVRASANPAYQGNERCADPEEAFVASLSTCMPTRISLDCPAIPLGLQSMSEAGIMSKLVFSDEQRGLDASSSGKQMTMSLNLTVRRTFYVMIALTLFLSVKVFGDDKPCRAYFVGNSVTDTIRYGSLANLAQSRGHTLTWGRDMIPGAPLSWLWEHPKEGFQEEPFGHYPRALSKYPWDVLRVQPFDRHLAGKEGDLAMAGNFIDIAQVYVDGIHFNNVGSYVVGATFYATLFREDPRGMTAEPYNEKLDPKKDRLIDEKLAVAIQDAIWTVVSKHPLAGVGNGSSREGQSVAH